ncbi:metallophosphoesterase [Aeromicrobium sp. Leaf350]|uniref:metallophosphoesterase family protein n=1 Tax=Aeromicrobium sp. Leaf350 TaxID=2876565 RepID=UPI001E38006F|nr:metallophosphoesterase family protein [Aeromicrobium sp. Leaf350]
MKLRKPQLRKPHLRTVASRLLALVVLVVVVAPVGVVVARTTFESSERSISIGAHQATLRPNYSGEIVVDFGPLLPLAKLPIEDAQLDIGARIQLGDADVASLDELLARDAVIASQPDGEIASVEAALRDMWIDSALRGAGVSAALAAVLAAGWWSIGAARRAEIVAGLRNPTPRRLVAGGTAAVVLVGGLVVAVRSDPTSVSDDVSWVKIAEVFPNLPSDPILERLELSDGAALRSGESLIEGAIRTYQESSAFFDRLAETAKDVEVRQPEEGQTVALVVTDRHDNVAVDPTARQIAENAGATMLLDLGDDTSNGASWEEFSINSLAREFEDFEIVAVAGNHDQGDNIAKHMEEKGFQLLKGEPVTIDGVRFIGDSDPRSSGLTKGYTGDEDDNIAAIKEQDQALTEAACDDGEVAVALVHSAAAARELSESGCVDLILSGHLHRQVGPDVVVSDDGESTVTLTTGTTGGAIYAFALGTGLRREAQMTLVTFENGVPVGLQLVDIDTGGGITPQEYVTLEQLRSEQAPTDPSTSPTDAPEPGPETVE